MASPLNTCLNHRCDLNQRYTRYKEGSSENGRTNKYKVTQLSQPEGSNCVTAGEVNSSKYTGIQLSSAVLDNNGIKHRSNQVKGAQKTFLEGHAYKKLSVQKQRGRGEI